MLEKLGTKIEIVEMDEENNYIKLTMSPLERGYGTTVGNSLRRVLLSSLPGSAPSSVRIEGVLHEFTIMEGVTEDVMELILNIKGIALKKLIDGPSNLHMDVKGPKVVTAGDFDENLDCEIANKDHYLATLNEDAHLQMDVQVKDGRGYCDSELNKEEDAPVGTIAIDSTFTPIKKCNYTVEDTRLGNVTDYDKLTLEVWTNGTTSPQEAVSESANLLIEYLDLFSDPENYLVEEEDEDSDDSLDQEKLMAMSIEDLDLSLRSFNCLKRAGITTVRDIVTSTKEKLSTIKNFGKKSYSEVEEKIESIGLTIPSEADDEFDDLDDID